jgi:UDPglucose 6-dehydrogenase
MFSLSKVGIIGLGYVGDAIRKNCEGVFQIVCIDVDPNKNTGTYQDLNDCEAVFVCVPSPSKPNGECDTSILNSVLYLLKDYKNVIICKTTAVPKFYEKVQEVYPNLVYVPEFLTAANAVRDFSCEDEIIIGGKIMAYQREAERILKQIQPIKNVGFCSIGEAALVKYIVNSFLATKVVFMNEMYELSNAHGYDWRKIRVLLGVDKRLGETHTKVPGPDNSFGFGGMCFPKDTNALIKYSDKLAVNLNVLKSAVKKNLTLRLKKSNDNQF